MERGGWENPQLVGEYRRWEICWIYSELSLNCFFSKVIKFTFKFYKVVNYSGNTLLQVENVIFTRLGFVFLEAPRFEAVERGVEAI